MKLQKACLRWLLAGAILLMALAGTHFWGRGQSAAGPSGTNRVDPHPSGALPPAAHLRLQVGASAAKGDTLLDPDAEAWSKAKPTPILLSRTPRIYQTEPPLPRPAPTCEARALRSHGKLYLRLEWDDPTKNAPEAPAARTGTAGEPKQLYKRPTGETTAFPDAFAVMVPERWSGPAFPSLLMGDTSNPARLYYWSASRGGVVLTASGRATPQPTRDSFPQRARHANGKWTVTLEMPEQADGYPIAFAVWDGQFSDRDGLKFFSIWYVLGPEVASKL
jgi:hypothetical protein